MKLETFSVSRFKSDFGKWASVCLVTSALMGSTFALVTVNATEINKFDRQPSCSLTAEVSLNIGHGKTCTSCHRWRPSSEFHKNKSKVDQLESHCKSCVSRRKELRRRQLRQIERRCFEFESVIVGIPDSTSRDAFAEVFGAALKEMFDDNQTKTPNDV